MTLAELTPELDYTETMKPVRQATHAPGHIYSDPEIYALEKEKIFLKDWLAVARVEELENPGDFMTFRIADEPIVVTRDNAGSLNAFANVCKHRGVEVATGTGNLNEFSCPYHGWLYDLEGKLVGAPYMKESEGFDPANCRLDPVNLGVWRGWVFVNLDTNCEPLEDFVADFEADFGFMQQDKQKIFAKFETTLDCNWKLVVENAMDKYHINTIHLDTLNFKTAHMDVEYFYRKRGGYGTFFEMEPRNNGHKLMFERNMPWLEDKPYNFATACFMAPNLQQFYYADNVESLTYWPLGVDKTKLIIYMLLPIEWADLPDREERIKEYYDQEVDVFEEDRDMVVSLQRAMSSKLFEPGRMCHAEGPIHHQLKFYLERMFGAQNDG